MCSTLLSHMPFLEPFEGEGRSIRWDLHVTLSQHQKSVLMPSISSYTCSGGCPSGDLCLVSSGQEAVPKFQEAYWIYPAHNVRTNGDTELVESCLFFYYFLFPSRTSQSWNKTAHTRLPAHVHVLLSPQNWLSHKPHTFFQGSVQNKSWSKATERKEESALSRKWMFPAIKGAFDAEGSGRYG